MPRFPHRVKGAGVLLALFSSLVHANEWQAYQDIKAALIRSTSKHDRPLPKWLAAQDFEPRAHYWLNEKKSSGPVLPEINHESPPTASPVTSAPVAPVSVAGAR